MNIYYKDFNYSQALKFYASLWVSSVISSAVFDKCNCYLTQPFCFKSVIYNMQR